MRSKSVFTNLQAERAYSIKKALESPRKKLAGPDYFHSAMFAACNKKHLIPLVVGPTESRVDHFSSLLKRARTSGRGLVRIASRSERKNRHRPEAHPIIDLSDSDEDDEDYEPGGDDDLDGTDCGDTDGDDDGNDENTGSDVPDV